MDHMISNAMEKFKELTDKNAVIEIDGRNYKRPGYEPVREPEISRLKTHTLESIVDAVTSKIENLDDIFNEFKQHIHVFSPTDVFLKTESFGPFLQRHILIEANAYTTHFKFGISYNPDEFIIALNTQFKESDDRKTLLALCSTISKDTAGTVKDNGISQRMEVKSGVSLRGDVEVKNPFTLQPFRTFSEIEQPASEFVFRVHDGSGVTCSLHEADGSAWKINAIKKIKAFFKEKLPDMPVIA